MPDQTVAKTKQMKPHELSADELNIVRMALRAHAKAVRQEFRDKYMGRFSGGKECAEELQTTEDLIERFDNADNVWMESSI